MCRIFFQTEISRLQRRLQRLPNEINEAIRSLRQILEVLEEELAVEAPPPTPRWQHQQSKFGLFPPIEPRPLPFHYSHTSHGQITDTVTFLVLQWCSLIIVKAEEATPNHVKGLQGTSSLIKGLRGMQATGILPGDDEKLKWNLQGLRTFWWIKLCFEWGYSLI